MVGGSTEATRHTTSTGAAAAIPPPRSWCLSCQTAPRPQRACVTLALHLRNVGAPGATHPRRRFRPGEAVRRFCLGAHGSAHGAACASPPRLGARTEPHPPSPTNPLPRPASPTHGRCEARSAPTRRTASGRRTGTTPSAAASWSAHARTTPRSATSTAGAASSAPSGTATACSGSSAPPTSAPGRLGGDLQRPARIPRPPSRPLNPRTPPDAACGSRWRPGTPWPPGARRRPSRAPR